MTMMIDPSPKKKLDTNKRVREKYRWYALDNMRYWRTFIFTKKNMSPVQSQTNSPTVCRYFFFVRSVAELPLRKGSPVD